MKSVYQTDFWMNAKKSEGIEEVILKNNDSRIIAFKKHKKFPVFGNKEILLSEGTPEYSDDGELLDILKKFKKESKKYFYGLIAPTIVNYPDALLKKAGFKKFSNYTVLVDLKRSEEELFNSLEKKSARWGVKTAQKNNLKFELLTNSSEVKTFYKLYESTAEKGHFEASKIDFILNLFNSEIARLFAIKKDNQIVAGGLMLLDWDNKYTILNLTAASDEGYKLQAMPFLYWNLIKYSKAQGMNFFDLGGHDIEAKIGDKTYNINKFKENFGGSIVEQPFYSSNLKYPILRRLLKVKKKFK